MKTLLRDTGRLILMLVLIQAGALLFALLITGGHLNYGNYTVPDFSTLKDTTPTYNKLQPGD